MKTRSSSRKRPVQIRAVRKVIQSCIDIEAALLTLFKLNQDIPDMFDDYTNISVARTGSSRICCNKLDKYLQLPVENVKDPLKWWVNNCKVYPNLSWMALDYLSIPSRHPSCISFARSYELTLCYSYLYSCWTGLLLWPATPTFYTQSSFSIIYPCLPLSWLVGPTWSPAYGGSAGCC